MIVDCCWGCFKRYNTLCLFQAIPVDYESQLYDSKPDLRLLYDAAWKEWKPEQPQAVMLLRANLSDATVAPVWQWQNVVSLNLSHNLLTELPNLDLPFLEVLNVSFNAIKSLPTQLRLPCLSTLDLAHNGLTDVTVAMKQLCLHCSELQSVKLLGNLLKVPTSEIMERGPDDVCQFFKDLARGHRICWSQTVLVVGQEEAGKTALCHALNGHRCADHAQMAEASTVGIDIVNWSTVIAIPRTNRSNYRQSHRHFV